MGHSLNRVQSLKLKGFGMNRQRRTIPNVLSLKKTQTSFQKKERYTMQNEIIEANLGCTKLAEEPFFQKLISQK